MKPPPSFPDDGYAVIFTVGGTEEKHSYEKTYSIYHPNPASVRVF